MQDVLSFIKNKHSIFINYGATYNYGSVSKFKFSI